MHLEDNEIIAKSYDDLSIQSSKVEIHGDLVLNNGMNVSSKLDEYSCRISCLEAQMHELLAHRGKNLSASKDSMRGRGL